jgi:hypothetical protein
MVICYTRERFLHVSNYSLNLQPKFCSNVLSPTALKCQKTEFRHHNMGTCHGVICPRLYPADHGLEIPSDLPAFSTYVVQTARFGPSSATMPKQTALTALPGNFLLFNEIPQFPQAIMTTLPGTS